MVYVYAICKNSEIGQKGLPNKEVNTNSGQMIREFSRCLMFKRENTYILVHINTHVQTIYGTLRYYSPLKLEADTYRVSFKF